MKTREFDIRVWDDVAKRMSYSKIELFDDMLGFRFEHFETDEPIFMQYTGLKDKNGRKIYEGDILKIDDDWEKWGFASGFVGYVIYDQGSFKLKEGEIYVPAYCLDSSAEEGATVIGNIFQDGDLLRDS
ncbi:YopX family protein [Bacillus smithii]|uniref:YopX family protein n=1 Tax=Bacillus smithii TaxID=1479 RepID=UPI002E1C08C0|nr:YopX family protein [Bacillus smithii]MED4929159.1 YopX family protein [Bacillus smithii]